VLYLRIWNDAAGDTHLERVAADFDPVEDYARGVPTVGVAPLPAAGSSHLLRFERGWVGDFHPAPRRQFLAQLTGRVRVTVTDGERVDAGPGTLWLVEDLDGKGHRSEVIGDEDVSFFVTTVE
jgi:hypothetical protein